MMWHTCAAATRMSSTALPVCGVLLFGFQGLESVDIIETGSEPFLADMAYVDPCKERLSDVFPQIHYFQEVAIRLPWKCFATSMEARESSR